MLLETRQIVGNPRTHKQSQSLLRTIGSYLCLPHNSELSVPTGHDVFLLRADKLSKYKLAKSLHTGKFFFWNQFSRMAIGTLLIVASSAVAYWWITRIRDDYHLVTVSEEITRIKKEQLYDANGFYYYGDPVEKKYTVGVERMQSYSDNWTMIKNSARSVIAVPFVFMALAQVSSMYYELKNLYCKLRTRFARVPKNVQAISTDDERYIAVLNCVDAAGVSNKEANRLQRELANNKDLFEAADQAPITSAELLEEFKEQISVEGPAYDATINAMSEVGHVIAKRDAKIDGSSEYVLEQKTRIQLTQALPDVANAYLGEIVSALAQSIRDERVEQAKDQFVESAVRSSAQSGAELSKSVLRSNAQSEAELILAGVNKVSPVK